MYKRLECRVVRTVVVVGLALLTAGTSWAAGEWEWTKDQGWMQGAGSSRPTPREQLQYAYELEQRGEYMDSARQYFLLVQSFPASQEAGVGLQRLARCLFEMENYYTSYKAIEQVIKDYPNTGRMQDLIEIELRIAKKMMVSQTPDILAAPNANPRETNIRRALEIVDAVLEHDPYGPVAPEAYLVKGEGHLFLNEVQTARAAFEKIRDDFPRSEFIERARLGILTCDSLLGQASPQELQDQIELVREVEQGRNSEDDVDGFIRKQNEVEAGKMLEQAEQYHQMGTAKAVKSAQFMFNEIVRRYPQTPQAETAMERLGKSRVPREPSRLTKIIKGVNINPFVINKDPEPPWIVPQLSPDDVVMVDQGLGPIDGVPETGAPPTMSAVNVRPATLPEPGSGTVGANFSPAPGYFDGTQGNMAQGPAVNVPAPSAYGPAPTIQTNPLPGTEGDLIGVARNDYPSTQGYSSGGRSAYAGSGQPMNEQPNLGSPMWNMPDTDLVGPAPRTDYLNAPIPEYGTADLVAVDPQPGSYYQNAAPTQTYQSPMYQEPSPAYAPPSGVAPGQGSGWTFGEEFR